MLKMDYRTVVKDLGRCLGVKCENLLQDWMRHKNKVKIPGTTRRFLVLVSKWMVISFSKRENIEEGRSERS